MKDSFKQLELWYALAWIALYVVGSSVMEGYGKLYVFAFHAVLTVAALLWILLNGRGRYYGLCAARVCARDFLYYLPLLALASCNLWFGVGCDLPVAEMLIFIGSMICVGFLEEVIFRGFLFRAIAKDSVLTAIVVTSITFGLGHLINLLNGADLLSNLCQVFSAVAFGFLFVTVFHRGGSLIPCIVTHSVINACSVFMNQANVNPVTNTISSAVLTVVAVAYAVILLKTIPEPQLELEEE